MPKVALRDELDLLQLIGERTNEGRARIDRAANSSRITYAIANKQAECVRNEYDK